MTTGIPLKIISLLVVVNIFLAEMIKSQNLTNIRKNKPVSISGGVNFSSTGYEVHGMDSRLDPFTWTVGGNLDVNFLGILDLPFSFMYSQGNHTFGQPSFNQFGMSPKYKFITVHAGYRSMQFSNYTLSGIMFLGGGIEITPESSLVKGSFMFGKFAKAVPYDSVQKQQYSNNLFGSPGYERWGYGGKLTIGTETTNVNFILFRAWDKLSSIPDPPVESGIKPMENLVLGISGTTPLFEHWKFMAEYTVSALTTDTRTPKQSMETYSYLNNLGGIFTPRETSVFNSAYNTGLSYNSGTWACEGNYKRIDPGFQSLGTTFLTNDAEDYNFKLSKTFMENKINVSVNSGVERNNLDNQLRVTNKRLIKGLDFSWAMNEKLSLSGNLSNYNASTAPSSITIVDTFKYVQVTENYNLTANYNFGNQTKRHSFSSSLVYQTVNTLNRTAILVTENGTRLYNANLAYTLSFVRSGINLTTSLSYNKYAMDEIITKSYGPTVCASGAAFRKKMKISLSYSLLDNVTSDKDNWMNMLKSAANYKIGKAHNFQLSLSFLHKMSTPTNNVPVKGINEVKGTFTYSYTFNHLGK